MTGWKVVHQKVFQWVVTLQYPQCHRAVGFVDPNFGGVADFRFLIPSLQCRQQGIVLGCGTIKCEVMLVVDEIFDPQPAQKAARPIPITQLGELVTSGVHPNHKGSSIIGIIDN